MKLVFPKQNCNDAVLGCTELSTGFLDVGYKN